MNFHYHESRGEVHQLRNLRNWAVQNLGADSKAVATIDFAIASENMTLINGVLALTLESGAGKLVSIESRLKSGSDDAQIAKERSRREAAEKEGAELTARLAALEAKVAARDAKRTEAA